MLRTDRLFCVEALKPSDPRVPNARALYESTQHPDERVPWQWIARGLKGRVGWQPGTTARHLLMAVPEADPGSVAGFALGLHLPHYGGYVSYLGVDETRRRGGVGSRLFGQMFNLFAADAGALGEPLPFAVWESKRPAADAPAADHQIWAARMRLFDRVGGLRVDGLELHSPNYLAGGDAAIKLTLFVKPIDTPRESFTPAEVRRVAAGLLERVYRMTPADDLYRASLPERCTPRLVGCLTPDEAAGRTGRLAGAGC